MDHDYIDKMFYFPFKGLIYMGQWSFESESVFRKILYLIYRVFTLIFGWLIVIFGFIDLYQNLNDLKRVIFNTCTTTFSLGVSLKNIQILGKSERIEKLRIQLFQDAQVQRDEEDVEIMRKFLKILTTIEKICVVVYVLFYPVWMGTSLMSLKWGPRELPFPFWTPADLKDNLQFAIGFLYQAFGGTFVVAEAAFADLAMYSLLLQLTVQFVILKKNMMKVNELYIVRERKEKNKYLLQIILREKFKRFLKRQLELQQYIMDLEEIYNQVMLIQFLGGLVVAIGNGLELILVLNHLSIKVFYQFAFFLVILSDLFVCCALADSLADECLNINKTLYSLEWHEMDNNDMKDILLMTTGTQKSPTLTVGKLFPLNLRTYLGFMKNLYSWLALFRQVVMKK